MTPTDHATRLLAAFSNHPPSDERLAEYALAIAKAPPEEQANLVGSLIDDCEQCPTIRTVKTLARTVTPIREAECGNQLCCNGWIPGIRHGIECVERCPACHPAAREPAAAG